MQGAKQERDGNKIICTIFLDHIKCVIYNICFSLSDFTPWCCLSSSTSLQMMQFRSILWLSNIPCVYVSHLLYPFLCWWTFKLFPCPGYCKQCCSERENQCMNTKGGKGQGVRNWDILGLTYVHYWYYV